MCDNENKEVNNSLTESDNETDSLRKFLDEIESLSVVDFSGIAEFLEQIAYKGFEPPELIEKMRQLQPDEEALAKDLSILIVQFLTSGRKSFVKKVSRKKKAEIINLKRVTKLYGITKNSSDREAVTLRRVAIAFAPVTVRILMKEKIERMVKNVELLTIAGESLPWCIRTQIYLNTLPALNSSVVAEHEAVFKTAVQATICYCYLESKVINKEGRENNWSNQDYMANVMKYSVIALKSKHVSENDRSDIWEETSPFLYEGLASMERLVQLVGAEVPEFNKLFQEECLPIMS